MGVQLTKKSNLGEFERKIQALGRVQVLVGIPQEKSSRDDNGDGITNAELLYIHAHGIRRKEMRDEMKSDMDKGNSYSKAFSLYIHSHGSPLWGSPPRPVIEPAIEAHKKEVSSLMKSGMKEYLQHNKSLIGLRRAGIFGATVSKSWFDDPRNGWAPNSPLTIKRKGSDIPLIDTGALRRSITYVIRED